MSISGANALDLPENRGTVCTAIPWLISHAPLRFQDVFLASYAQLRTTLDGARGPSFLVVAVNPGGQPLTYDLVDAVGFESTGGAVVIGRHSQALICLADDPSVALRHILARATCDSSGNPRLRLLDLKTGQGFEVEDAGTCEAIETDGPAFVTLGSYGLMVFPVFKEPEPWPESAERGWDRLPRTHLLDSRPMNHPPLNGVSRLAVVSADVREHSQITILTGLRSPRPPSLGRTSADTWATLTLRHGTSETVFTTTARDLETGVLLGRYSRCDVGSGELDSMLSVSRVHAVILKEGDRVFLIDTASSNGTTIDHLPVAIAELQEAALIDLGGEAQMHWQVVTLRP